MKKYFALFLAVLICLSAVGMTAFAAAGDVTVTVDGKLIQFDQPPIIVNGRTLVPIRAVCEELGATVSWDGSTETASVTKGSLTLSLKINSYTMRVNDGTNVSLDVPPQIYNGRTLLPIRAVVERLGSEVSWDEINKIVIINRVGSAAVPGVQNTQVGAANNWASVSSVQQFAYKDEGIAYGYIKGNYLEITTPSKQLSLEKRYTSLGDVIADELGNFYVVWGRVGSAHTEETVFISKYSPEGAHIKTTGFKGESIMGTDGNTKTPFHGGNCVSAIGNGYLMVNYARTMYNGHQSNNVIGVKLSDMSAVSWNSVWDIPYTSHSFNQGLIWSEDAGEFVYADQGDAYGRGFIITAGGGEKNIFHFYLEANANYNMFIVNKTFAQLGGLAETSKGVAFVGASAKSISEAAKTEKQNLFVQIFNPLAKEVSPSMFVGGSARSGATSTNINDNTNSPLTSVTDYGVRWLTSYTDVDVVAPQVVSAGDRLVILWSTTSDTFYMVLSASGEVITPATSLGGLGLNSFEPPVYHDGAVWWVSVRSEILTVNNIKI